MIEGKETVKYTITIFLFIIDKYMIKGKTKLYLIYDLSYCVCVHIAK